MTDKRKTPSLKTAEKALDVLDVIGESAKPLTASEIAAMLEMTLSSTYKFLSTLTERGYLDYHSKGKCYQLSTKILHFANNIRNNMGVNRIALPFMQELATKTRETVHLGMVSGIYGVFVEKIDSPHTIGVQTRIGTRTLLSQGATAKALMAFVPAEVMEELCGYLAQKYPERPQLIEEARAQRQEIRQQGWTFTCEEVNSGVAAVAAPIFGAGGELAASLAVAAPKERLLPEDVERYRPMVIETCRQISAAMGCREDQVPAALK